ncbi:MAG: YitT family protein [Arachidicoccus sp.]|nr:YitT family protein [Arachidicoccus sp.]
MHNFLENIIRRIIYGEKKSVEKKNAGTLSEYKMAKGYRLLFLNIKHNIRSTLLIIAGIFSASFGLKGFLLTNHFIDGGVTGISLLLSGITKAPLYIFLICINIPFVFMGYKTVSKQFAIKTGLAITGLALCVALVHFPDVTKDNLLVAVFGGFFLGAGIGMSIRGGAVIDGTEVLALYLSKKFGTTIGDIIIIINIIIFSSGAYFLGIEPALYSMITYLAASKTLDFVVEGIEEYIGVTIISSHSKEISEMIVNQLGRGITVYSAKRGYGKRGAREESDILYTVITRLELNKLNTEIQKIDEFAFVVMSPVKDTKGGMIKKRPLNH